MSRRYKYDQVMDGDWMHLPKSGMYLACCDCGLVHDLDVEIRHSKIFLKVKRDARRTAAVRRGFKFESERDEEWNT